MPYELREVKELRKKFNLTQSDLARKANVSQSLIAKIESNKIDPTYTNVRRIFEVLTNLRDKNNKKAYQIMTKKIYSVKPSSKINDVIRLMKRYQISQLPVISKKQILGLISESTILNNLTENPEKLVNFKVEEIMEDSPPILSENTTIDTISELLHYFPIVIVSKKGKFSGVITRSDILKSIH